MKHVRLAFASLEEGVNDPSDRYIMPMSTLISSEMWLIETAWDGIAIGDVQIYINDNCNKYNSQPKRTEDGKPLQPAWRWWAGVPRGKVKGYRFLRPEAEHPLSTDAEPEKKPGKPSESSTARA